jgi:threonine dehydratase
MRADIEAASERIAGYVRTTPVVQLEAGAWGLDGHLVLKLEQLQHTGSFKPRGAFNRILTHHVPPTGVIAASGGNHGVAVASVAQRLGYQAEIFVPEHCPPVKVERLRSYGAQVHLVGTSYADALLASETRAAQTGALVVHAYDQPEVVTGQGTLGYEFAQQVPDVDTILVAVGGGGLIGGIAAWFEGKVRVIGVEPESASSMAAALKAGKPIDVEEPSIPACTR